jgi:4-amino-4-deoxy-L-arabinose transferase-like glycosyltransferase
MANSRRFLVVGALLILAAFAFRFAVARYLPNDEPGDGKVYAQMARDLLEQHVYSAASEPPFEPTLIRLPGYPLFLAGIYSLFGHDNNGAVRLTQAVLDTASCAIVALLAYFWEPDAERKRAAAIAALAFAAVCPFTTIYTATILTETSAVFLSLLLCLSATLAFRSTTLKRSIVLWSITGLIGGLAVLFRPDSALFAGAVGLVLVADTIQRRVPASADAASPLKPRVVQALILGSVFSIAFCIVLVPWTIRNRRVFHVFQPLAPAHAEMPGEFVPRGYLAWLRTWMEDQKYIGPVLWKLEEAPINIDDFPDAAFDSKQEKDQVAALLDKYNHPQGTSAPNPASTAVLPPEPNAQNNRSHQANSNQEEPEEGSEESNAESDDETNTEQDQPEDLYEVDMTPEIDAAFARIAQERLSRSPFRYYLQLPFRRAISLWFDTHSQYYPFEGELLPFEDLDYDIHQQFWLPLFAGLTWIYTLLGATGAWLLWRSGNFEARRWAVLVSLIVILRIGFFSTLENPEPRYVVELFPFLSVLAGIAVVGIAGYVKRVLTQKKAIIITE